MDKNVAIEPNATAAAAWRENFMLNGNRTHPDVGAVLRSAEDGRSVLRATILSLYADEDRLFFAPRAS